MRKNILAIFMALLLFVSVFYPAGIMAEGGAVSEESISSLSNDDENVLNGMDEVQTETPARDFEDLRKQDQSFEEKLKDDPVEQDISEADLVSRDAFLPLGDPQPERIINIVVYYVINDAAKTVIAQAHKATIPLGYSERETIEVPVAVGYHLEKTEPEMQPGFGLSEDKSSYTLDYRLFSEDTKIYLLYEGNSVEYTVEHLLEDLQQGTYTVDESMKETLQAKVGERVKAQPKEIEGFTPQQPLQSEEIPAGGKLNLQVRYSRNIYQISYDTDGGTYIPSESKLFGAPLTAPETPSKTGYTFDKWLEIDAEGNEKIFSFEENLSMPARTLKLKASWLQGEKTPYRLAYYVQNEEDDNYSFVAYVKALGKTGEKVSIPENGGDPKTGFGENLVFPGLKSSSSSGDKLSLMKKYFDRAYLYNSAKTEAENASITIAGDGTTVAPVYFDRQIFTLIIADDPDLYNQNPPETHDTIKKNGKLYEGDDLYKVTVRFGQTLDPLLVTEQDIVGYETSKYFIQDFQVYGDLNENSFWLGEQAPRILSSKFLSMIKPWEGFGAEPGKTTFWLIITHDNKNNNLTINEFFQDIDGNYPSTPKSVTTQDLSPFNWFQKDRAIAGFSPDPAKQLNYIQCDKNGNELGQGKSFVIQRDGDSHPTLFKGDYYLIDENKDGVFEKKVKEEKGYTMNADGKVDIYYLRNQYPLKLHYNFPQFTAEADSSQEIYYEAPYFDKLPDSTKMQDHRPSELPPEYEFKGWYTELSFKDEQKVGAESKMPAHALDLFAKWGPPESEYTVIIEPDNGTEATKKTVAYGERVKANDVTQPTKSGFDFVNWKLKESTGDIGSWQIYDFSRPVTRNITLVAQWRKKTLADLTIRYIEVNEDGEEVKTLLPDKTVKEAVVGTDYTFKSENISNYWPDKLSKGIHVDAEASRNVLIFKYKPFNGANYTIRYITRSIDAQGQTQEKDIAKKESVTTDKAIDTRNYKEIPGYAPITLQQTLRLAWDENNVMTFVYKVNDQGTNEAAYRVEYYFEDAKGQYILDKGKSKDFSGPIGATINFGNDQRPLVLDGFVLNQEKSDRSIIITTPVQAIAKMYYDRQKPDKTVEHGSEHDHYLRIPAPQYLAPMLYQQVPVKDIPQAVHQLPATGSRDSMKMGMISLALGLVILLIKKQRS